MNRESGKNMRILITGSRDWTDREKRFTSDAGTDLTFVFRVIEQDVEKNTTTVGWTMRGKIVIPLGEVKFE